VGNPVVLQFFVLTTAEVVEVLLSHAIPSASYNSWEQQTQATCLPGTRAVVLDQIQRWADSSNDRAVCWLYGPAGSGKTTIATTIAAKYAQNNRLAGSFFFSRDPGHQRQSVDNVIATIAYQNAVSHPVVQNKIRQVLDFDSNIFTKSLEIQFDHLLIGPVRRRRFKYMASARNTIQTLCKAWIALNLRFNSTMPAGAQTLFEVCSAFLSCVIFYPPIDGVARLVIMILVVASLTRLPTSLSTIFHPPPLLVIIDALDECDDSAKSLINVIANNYHDSPAPIRFFLTSRQPEDKQITGAFRQYHDRIHFINLLDSPAHNDIRLFSQKEFNNLQIKHSQYFETLKESWPSSSDIDSIVNKSQGLFIYASTLLNFVGDMDQGEIPVQRLKHAMLQDDGLDALYRKVLQDAPEFNNPDFKPILGALCFLHDALSLGSLVVLLRLGSATNARRVLRGCKSFLHIPPTDHENITFLHMSFHDFLTDRNRNRWIDPVEQHLSILYDCVQLIVSESQRSRLIKETDSDFAELSTRYAWANWHRHLVDLEPSGGGTVNRLKTQFGEQYESLFLCFLDGLGDKTFQRRAITPPGLEPNISRSEDEVRVLLFFSPSHLCSYPAYCLPRRSPTRFGGSERHREVLGLIKV
jgi:hypothetical protein